MSGDDNPYRTPRSTPSELQRRVPAARRGIRPAHVVVWFAMFCLMMSLSVVPLTPAALAVVAAISAVLTTATFTLAWLL
jgi:hypothetical protein